MVSGSRQRNSKARLIHCTRSLTQIIVGSSSATMTMLVMTASSRVSSTALASPG